METDYRPYLLQGLILVAAIFISFLVAYAIFYMAANYGVFVLILALVVLITLRFLYKKHKKMNPSLLNNPNHLKNPY